MLSEVEYNRALQVSQTIKSFFQKSKVDRVRAKDLMDEFIKQGIWEKDHRKGLPIRNLLRRLDKEGKLDVIPYAEYEQKKVNKNWFFSK